MYVVHGIEGPYNHAKPQSFSHSKSCEGKFKFYFVKYVLDYKFTVLRLIGLCLVTI